MKSKNVVMRKAFIVWVIVIASVAGFVMAFDRESSGSKNIVVYKDPSCACCTKWITHLKKNDFNVEVHNQRNMTTIKSQLLVPDHLKSCHTASINGYSIEGHVSADLIDRLIDERPNVTGLAVPGMPMGSPGMEGHRKDAYEVLAFQKGGETSIYAKR